MFSVMPWRMLFAGRTKAGHPWAVSLIVHFLNHTPPRTGAGSRWWRPAFKRDAACYARIPSGAPTKL